MVHLASYLRGSNRPLGFSHSRAGKFQLAYRDGPKPGQRLTIKGVHPAPGRFEEVRFLHNGIYRGWDISDRPNVYRLTEGNLPVSFWAPDELNLGEWVRREATVTRIEYNTGRILSVGTHVTWLRLVAHYDHWKSYVNFPVDDVIELAVYDGEDGRTKQPFELYQCAKDLGMVGHVDVALQIYSGVNFIWDEMGKPLVPVLEPEPLPPGYDWEDVPEVPTHSDEPPIVIVPLPPAERWIIRSDIPGANVRERPTTENSKTLRVAPPGSSIEIRGLESPVDGEIYRWAQVSGGGYIREDLFTNYQAPITVVQKFSTPILGPYSVSTRYTASHKGLDLAGEKGLPIVAGGTGQVAFLYNCTECLATPTVRDAGLPLNDPGVLSNPRWGYGYGPSVVVRFRYANLPLSAREAMDRVGLTNGFLYVLFGHLDSVRAEVGQCVGRDLVIGYLGEKGNTSGPHLHLEVRGSMLPNEGSILNRTPFDPSILFSL